MRVDTIMDTALRKGLLVIENAAQGLSHTWREVSGHHRSPGCLSFHETKNIISGRRGILINDDRFVKRAEIILRRGRTGPASSGRGGQVYMGGHRIAYLPSGW
jgi:dTDP-4-amino-4,6-dideoxygalactose transaminase